MHERAIATLLGLIEGDRIRVYKIPYNKEKAGAVGNDIEDLYIKIANLSRWKVDAPEMRDIRLNALNVGKVFGEAEWRGIVYYAESNTALRAGNMKPHDLLLLWEEHPDIKQLVIFPYPYTDHENEEIFYLFMFHETMAEFSITSALKVRKAAPNKHP